MIKLLGTSQELDRFNTDLITVYFIEYKGKEIKLLNRF